MFHYPMTQVTSRHTWMPSPRKSSLHKSPTVHRVETTHSSRYLQVPSGNLLENALGPMSWYTPQQLEKDPFTIKTAEGVWRTVLWHDPYLLTAEADWTGTNCLRMKPTLIWEMDTPGPLKVQVGILLIECRYWKTTICCAAITLWLFIFGQSYVILNR